MASGDWPPHPSRAGEVPPPPSFSAPLPYAPNDTRAVVSLVLGLASLVTCGLTGVPAVALGFSSRAAIQRSGGMLRGEGLAAGGIATGLAGTALGMIAVAALIAGIFAGARSASAHRPPPAAPRATTTWAPGGEAPSAPSATTVGGVRVVDLDPDAKRTFHQQLSDEYRRATTAHETVLLMTNQKTCGPCKEIEDALSDARMQTALANVDIVRVDVDDFRDELDASHMLEHTLPWFYKLDSTLRPVDAISAGEWDDNVPENMAPVLEKFVSGTLRARREAPQVGTSL